MLPGPAPDGVNFRLRPEAPDRKAGMRNPNHPAHPLRPIIEVGVAEKASDKRTYFILSHARHNQAVPSMPEIRVIEARVAGEKRGIALLAQQNDNLLILHAFATQVESNLSRRQPPRFEYQALSVKDVLVEDDQA